LAIAAAISLASFAERILVKAGGTQFRADIAPRRPQAGLAIAAAIAFAAFAKLAFHFASAAQLLAIATPAAIVNPDASGPNLNRLGKCWGWGKQGQSCGCGNRKCKSAHETLPCGRWW
jgi:hypothetical protein